MTTLTAKFWASPDYKIQRIYLGTGYIEMKHIGGGRGGWSDEMQNNSTVAPGILAALAAKLETTPDDFVAIFERFNGETEGYGSDSKAVIARKRRTHFTIEIA